MLDRQARQLNTQLKALPKSKEHACRKAVTANAPTELNPGERSDVSWITTESVDRTLEVVVARGMKDGQFTASSLATLQHAYGLLPVGRSLWRKRVKDGAFVAINAKTEDSRPGRIPGPRPSPGRRIACRHSSRPACSTANRSVFSP